MSTIPLPAGWAWRCGLTDPFEDPYEELVDAQGNVVASVDRLTSPPEYTVMGMSHLLSPEDWQARPGSNVACASIPDVRAAAIDELARLGMIPDAEVPRASLADESMGSIVASRTLAQGCHTALPRAPPAPWQR